MTVRLRVLVPALTILIAIALVCSCAIAASAVGRYLGSSGRYGAPLFSGDGVPAAQAAALRASGQEAAAKALAPLLHQPIATWFTGQADVRHDVAAVARAAGARGAVPVLVAYAIPQRDCGGLSAQSTTVAASAYRSWLRAFAAGLQGSRAIVVLEPDALAQLDCLDARGAAERLALLRYGVHLLAAEGSWVYLDGGNSAWRPVVTMAGRLRQAGVAQAAGFSLDVANFQTTAHELAYGHRVSAALGGAHFVVDTSRNGRGPAGSEWCNPPGRAIGRAPTTATGDPLVDAFLWIKVPGESDGTCNGGPPAGTWWSQYAAALARGAHG